MGRKRQIEQEAEVGNEKNSVFSQARRLGAPNTSEQNWSKDKVSAELTNSQKSTRSLDAPPTRVMSPQQLIDLSPDGSFSEPPPSSAVPSPDLLPDPSPIPSPDPLPDPSPNPSLECGATLPNNKN